MKTSVKLTNNRGKSQKIFLNGIFGMISVIFLEMNVPEGANYLKYRKHNPLMALLIGFT